MPYALTQEMAAVDDWKSSQLVPNSHDKLVCLRNRHVRAVAAGFEVECHEVRLIRLRDREKKFYLIEHISRGGEMIGTPQKTHIFGSLFALTILIVTEVGPLSGFVNDRNDAVSAGAIEVNVVLVEYVNDGVNHVLFLPFVVYLSSPCWAESVQSRYGLDGPHSWVSTWLFIPHLRRPLLLGS